MKQFTVKTEEELDSFDDQAAYFEHNDSFSVLVEDTGEVVYPIYFFRENGDMDGFMGWSCEP